MPYQSPDPFASIKGSLIRAGAPVTMSVITVSAVLFLIDFFGRGIASGLLGCQIADHVIFPFWSPITYALVNPGFISVVFGCMWLWFIGGSLEGSWGAQRYSIYLAASTLITALCVWTGCSILHLSYTMIGPWLPLTVLTVSWATLNPRAVINLYGIIPVPAWALAAFEVGMVYFVYMQANPILGLFGLIPSALGWFYVHGGFSSGYQYRGYVKRGPDLRMTSTTKPLDGSFRGGFNPGSWWRDQQEKRKLRKLWRNSGLSDKDFKK